MIVQFAALWLMAASGASPAEDWKDCKGDEYQTVIRGCTRVLKAGSLSRSDTVDAYANRGWAFYNTNDNERALADYGECVKQSPENAICHNGMSAVYIEKQQYVDALASADKALAINPRYQYAFLNKGRALDAMSSYTQAIEQLTKALDIAPGWANAYYRRGRTYANVDRFEDAIAEYDKALLINPKYSEVYGVRGFAHRVLKHNEMALADLNSAVAADAKDDWSLAMRATVYLATGENEKALSDLERAVSMSPAVNWYRNQRGIALMRLGRTDKAVADFTKVIKDLPGNAIANANLGLIKEKSGDKEAAKAAYRAAMTGEGTDPDTRDAQKMAL